jgi:hypothetical protein
MNSDTTLTVLGNDVPNNIVPINQAQEIALLPVRMEWNKREGFWSSEDGSFEGDQLTGNLRAVCFVYAEWSDTVGKPLTYEVGHTDNPNAEQGIRIFFEIEDLGFYYCDLFGLAKKAAQGLTKHLLAKDLSVFEFNGSRPISTNNGMFYVPKLNKEFRG